MSSNFKFELNRAGVLELLKSEEARNVCKSYADRAAQSLGDGYVVTTHSGRTRVNASVYAESAAAKAENNEHNTILKAVFGQ